MTETEAFLRQTGARIREARLRRGLNQTELAKKTGKTQDTISRYEAGTREMGISELPKFAQALELPISYFVGESGANPALELANEILVPSMRLAATVTIFRSLRMQKFLIDTLAAQAPDTNNPLTHREIDDLLSEFREATFNHMERYRDSIAQYYVNLSRQFPQTDVLASMEIDPEEIYAEDVRKMIEERRKRDDPHLGVLPQVDWEDD